MPARTRRYCLAILLMLLFGHASIAAHAASHLASDTGDCEYCTSHNHPTPAVIPADGALVDLPKPDTPPVLRHLVLDAQASVATVRQRGPPPLT